MYVAIAVGTLLLGGWTLNTPIDEEESALPEQPSRSSQGISPGQQRQIDRGQGRAAPGESGQRMRGSGTRMQRQTMPSMPMSPTEALPPGANGMLGQPNAPTANIPPTGTPRMGRSSEAFQPSAPTERREFPSEAGYRPMSHGLSGGSRMSPSNSGPAMMAPPQVMQQQQAAMTQQTTEKAFSGYQPTSGVSPYMNLFRTGTGGGTIDNYTTLVRPQVEQRFLNRQIGQELRGLQNNSRIQGTNLQQLNQQSRALEGVGTPQFYMNYGNYYSGYGQ